MQVGMGKGQTGTMSTGEGAGTGGVTAEADETTTGKESVIVTGKEIWTRTAPINLPAASRALRKCLAR